MKPRFPTAGRKVLPGGIIGRAIFFAPVFLALWWFVLKSASLWLLWALSYFPLGLLVAPAGYDPVKIEPATGAWVFNVAVNTNAKNPRTGRWMRIDSSEFTADKDSVAFFACGWFSYMALAFSASAGFSRAKVKQVSKGLALQSVINVLSLAVYAYINGYGAVINNVGDPNSTVWFFKYVYHIIYLVIPFAGPFAVAVLVHPEWRLYLGITGQRNKELA